MTFRCTPAAYLEFSFLIALDALLSHVMWIPRKAGLPGVRHLERRRVWPPGVSGCFSPAAPPAPSSAL